MTDVSLDDRFSGSLLGLALGDACGEHPDAEGTLRWTDDTLMALGLARSLAQHGGIDQDALAARWADDFDPRRGYGGGTSRLLTLIGGGTDWRAAVRSVFPDGSFGNGAAMRAGPAGLFFHADESTRDAAAEDAAAITHAHPRGLEGGRLVAHAVARALQPDDGLPASIAHLCRDAAFRARLEHPEPLANGVLAIDSVPTAIHLYTRFRDAPFTAALAAVVELGGDRDTIGAMVGSMWGARNGRDALPRDLLDRLEGAAAIEDAARALLAAARA